MEWGLTLPWCPRAVWGLWRGAWLGGRAIPREWFRSVVVLESAGALHRGNESASPASWLTNTGCAKHPQDSLLADCTRGPRWKAPAA
jgi:hypothetical protein